ncbi:MAG: ywoC [Chloroflexi bacterium]|nr:ywoC [Chloroflexota bacterium]
MGACHVTEFPIIPAKTGMLFFDTLNRYLHPEDPKAQATVDASGIIQRMARMMQACRENGIAIFYGQADHRPDGKDFAQQIVSRGYGGAPGVASRTKHTPWGRGSFDMEVIPELAPQTGDYVIKKHRWSTFYQTHFELSLRTAGIDTLMMAGGSTGVGIASTAYSARDRDFNLIILRDICSSNPMDINEFFMDRVFPTFARVLTMDEALADIERG